MSEEGRLRRGKVFADKGINNSEAQEYLDSIKTEEPIKKAGLDSIKTEEPIKKAGRPKKEV